MNDSLELKNQQENNKNIQEMATFEKDSIEYYIQIYFEIINFCQLKSKLNEEKEEESKENILNNLNFISDTLVQLSHHISKGDISLLKTILEVGKLKNFDLKKNPFHLNDLKIEILNKLNAKIPSKNENFVHFLILKKFENEEFRTEYSPLNKSKKKSIFIN